MKEFDPGDKAASIVSVTDRVRPLALGMAVTSVHFLGETARLRRRRGKRGARRAPRARFRRSPSTAAAFSARHPTASASSWAATTARSSRSTPRARSRCSRPTSKRRWIDNVALHPDGAFAWSAGKTGLCPQRQGRGKILRGALDRRRPGVCAEGPAARDRALQRRDAVVSQHGGQRRIPGMGRLASRRHLQPRQQIPGHRDARAGAAWLAARRQQAHAHDRLSRPRPLDVLERGRQGAGDLGRRYRDHLAVRQQGRPDGQGARDAGAAAGARLRGRLPSEATTSSPPATATAPC